MVMLLAALAAHPPALESVDLPVATVAHVHDQGSRDAGNLSHHVLHHDHHLEMISQQTVDISASAAPPSAFAPQDKMRIVQVYLDRPPRTARS